MKTGKILNRYTVLISFTIILIIGLSIIKYRCGEINYTNSDATWHVLYTLQCFDETPISVHKFLPLVTLGTETDKWITWGASIPDSLGNYYYTSFSPMGYVVPYLFFKLFHLGFTENSLYIFNTLLFVLYSVITSFFLMDLFRRKTNCLLIALIGVIVCIMQPELMHSMGIVYWHQSLMQLTLLIQIYAYYIYREKTSRREYILFLLMCIINPYTEWTGFVANAGFALAEVLLGWKQNKYKAILEGEIVALLTVVSFGIFCFHYLLNIDAIAFFSALKNRFFERNFTTQTPLKQLIDGYLSSFQYTWILLTVFLITEIGIFIYKKRITSNKIKNTSISSDRYVSVLLQNKYLLNIAVRRSRQSGVARATCPD